MFVVAGLMPSYRAIPRHNISKGSADGVYKKACESPKGQGFEEKYKTAPYPRLEDIRMINN
ncbi:MAG TPA: hypothetical protein O0Y13_03155, partial [Methanocorpusculum sp.]|nr:hypothetical protein [Methanocorpusculum sp.]